VILQHPPNKTLTSEEFAKRIVGTIMLPYIRGDEVWGIAKILDAEAADAMQSLPLSTSPSVIIKKSESRSTEMKDGRTLLIEGEPYLIDHLAVVPSGVWDRGEGPNGIEITERNNMSDEQNSGKEGRELDKLLSKVDSAMTKFGDVASALADRMDKFGERLDALERERDERDDGRRDRRDRARRDEDSRERREPGEAKPVVADCTEERDPAYHNRMTDAQAKADAAYSCWGQRAPKYLQGESLSSYRRRLLGPHQRHSKKFQNAILETITDASIMNEIEAAIYADSMTAATSPEAIGPGLLRMVSERTDAGHTINRFYGDPACWMENFMGGRRKYITGINPKGQRAL
jgi:hypothetical protein